MTTHGTDGAGRRAVQEDGGSHRDSRHPRDFRWAGGCGASRTRRRDRNTRFGERADHRRCQGRLGDDPRPDRPAGSQGRRRGDRRAASGQRGDRSAARRRRPAGAADDRRCPAPGRVGLDRSARLGHGQHRPGDTGPAGPGQRRARHHGRPRGHRRGRRPGSSWEDRAITSTSRAAGTATGTGMARS